MVRKNITVHEWIVEAMKPMGGNMDLDEMVDFMIWLRDGEGKYSKEELRMVVKQFLDSRR